MIKKFRPTRAFVLATVAVALLFITIRFNMSNRIAMSYDDHKVMEQEILHHIPLGSSIQHAHFVLSKNGFKHQKRTGEFLEFEKETWPFPEISGTAWKVKVQLKNEAVADVKVWIYPSD